MSCLLLHEPKRLAGVETDSPKVNPQGDQTERRTGHQPRRGIGGKAASRRAARRVNLPSGGRFSNINEDVRRYTAEPSGANRSAAKIARQSLHSSHAGKQIIHRMTRRASRAASQKAISEAEALQRGMEEKSKGFVEPGAEVYTNV